MRKKATQHCPEGKAGAGRSFFDGNSACWIGLVVKSNHTLRDKLYVCKHNCCRVVEHYYAIHLSNPKVQCPVHKGSSDAPLAQSCLTSACPEKLKPSPEKHPLRPIELADVCSNTEKLVSEQDHLPPPQLEQDAQDLKTQSLCK